MYLSYSGWKKLSECEYAYWLSYVGKVAIPGVDNMVNSLFGAVVGGLFEDFYTHGFWRKTTRGGLSSEQFLTGRVTTKFKQIVREKKRKGQVVLWNKDDEGAIYETKDELLADVHDAIRKGLQSIRHHKLIGPEAKAELKLDCEVNGHKIAGRADFVLTRMKPHLDLIILDGKGSKPRNRKYVDPDQLRWYGMLYQRKFGRAPDKLGFLFWRMGFTDSIDWLAFTEDDLSEMMTDVLETVESVENKVGLVGEKVPLASVRGTFTHSPGKFNCRFCPYATDDLCPEGSQVVQQIT